MNITPYDTLKKEFNLSYINIYNCSTIKNSNNFVVTNNYMQKKYTKIKKIFKLILKKPTVVNSVKSTKIWGWHVQFKICNDDKIYFIDIEPVIKIKEINTKTQYDKISILDESKMLHNVKKKLYYTIKRINENKKYEQHIY